MSRGTKNRNANGIGSIRKKTVKKGEREYTYWEGRCTTGYDPVSGKQIQRSITGKTQKEVAQKLKQMAVEVDRGTYLPPSKLTVKEWLEIWLADYMGSVKASTAYLYKRNMEQYIIPFLGEVKLDSLNPHTIQKLYNDLHNPKKEGVKPLSAKTIRNVHGTLHKALQQAVELGYLRTNPTDACKPPRVVKKEIHPLDECQIMLFLNAIVGHVHEILFRLALFTGLREGELLGLTWSCIDFKNRTLLVKQQLRKEQKKGGKYYFSPPKNNKSRILVLAPSIIDLLKEQQIKQKQMRIDAGELWTENDLVFSNQTGGFLSYRTVYDCFKRVVAKIGVPKTRFHDLRHTYAVISLKQGDDVKTVQENLGHATATFTLEVYAHVTAHMKQGSANRMEQYIQSLSS